MCNKCNESLKQNARWCIECGQRLFPINSGYLNIEIEFAYEGRCYIRTLEGDYYVPITFKASLNSKINNHRVNFRQISDARIVRTLNDLYSIVTGDTLPE